MIKLIATDLDGTLINGITRAIPQDLEEVWDRLNEKGIVLLAASGRDYNGAAQFFGPMAEKMMFICDNGANIYDKGRLLETHSISRENVHRLLDMIAKIDNADPMLCGMKGTYVTAGCPAFMKKMSKHYSPLTWVDNLYEIDDEIFKVSVYDATGDIKGHTYEPLVQQTGDDFTIHMSANIWVDIMDTAADKGIALNQVQSMLKVTKEETMAFGDFYNDIPLLDQAGFAFVMANGTDDMKARYPYQAASNNEDGVTKAIKEWVLDKQD
ncbi:MAG: HAD family phosphatase [Oscillospiraceae bacterium]|nr:HAD family phosphatase [Oscillospiraceae bacterium]